MNQTAARRIKFVIGFLAYFSALWLLWDTQIIYPLKIFVVLLHELSHGIAALATGGSIQRIVITPDQGGACFCPGNAFLTLSAGYLGSLLWGVAMLMVVRARERWHRIAVAVIGALVVGASILYVRNGFGFVFGLAFGLGLVGVSRFLPDVVQRVTLTALGLTSCLYAILDIKSDILDRPELQSDARMLAEITGVPTVVWGVAWIGVALAVSWWLFRRTLRSM